MSLPDAAAARFYRKPLPPSCVSFASEEGRKLFRAALVAGHAESFFAVSSQFSTQAEPTFCGLSTLSMSLNALSIDPGRAWKGVWRWFAEDMLDCCAPIEEVRAQGISLNTFACLAQCNGASVEVYRPCGTPLPLAAATNGVAAAKVELDVFPYASLARFRQTIRDCTSTPEGTILAVAYSRKGVDQTGDGHFSPLGAYDPASDSVLIMDVARFKHPPHWVTVPTLFRAMLLPDPDTGLPRGWVILRRNVAAPLLLFHFAGHVTPSAASAALGCSHAGVSGPGAASTADSGQITLAHKSSCCGAGARPSPAPVVSTVTGHAAARTSRLCTAGDLGRLLRRLQTELAESMAACEGACCYDPAEVLASDSGSTAKAADDTHLVLLGVRCFVRCYIKVTAALGHPVTTLLDATSMHGFPISNSSDSAAIAAGRGEAFAAAGASVPAGTAPSSEWEGLSPEHRLGVAELLAALEATPLFPVIQQAVRERRDSDGIVHPVVVADAPRLDDTVVAPQAAAATKPSMLAIDVRVEHIVTVMLLVWSQLGREEMAGVSSGAGVGSTSTEAGSSKTTGGGCCGGSASRSAGALHSTVLLPVDAPAAQTLASGDFTGAAVRAALRSAAHKTIGGVSAATVAPCGPAKAGTCGCDSEAAVPFRGTAAARDAGTQPPLVAEDNTARGTLLLRNEVALLLQQLRTLVAYC
jgi:glutathione gamma-glutamylcysteinyltransferase